MSYECFSISCDAFLLRSVISSHDLGFSEKSFLSEIWVSMGVDAIALNFLKKLDFTDCSIWVLERLDFYSDMM